jgi:hypothetical protein
MMRRHDDGHVAAMDWAIGSFNVVAGLLCISAAASNYIVYGISLRIAALMVFFSVSALVFILLEILPLAGYAQRSASHLNTFAGRATHYFLTAILASDTVFVHIPHYNLYIWLWSNSVALASISLAFVVLAVTSSVTDWIPPPRSMDVQRSWKPDPRCAIHTHAEDLESSRVAFVHPDMAYDKFASMATMDGTSISALFPSKLDKYTTPVTSTVTYGHRGSNHAHGNKWLTHSPPAHASMWTGSNEDGSQCSTPRIAGARRLSSQSGSHMAAHHYETTTQRAQVESSGPPSAWSDHLATTSEKLTGLSSFHRELKYDAVQMSAEEEEDRKSTKTERRLSPLQTQTVRVKSLRRRVFIPSAGAAIELSSGESSSESDGEDDDSDGESVYSLPSGISPETDSPADLADRAMTSDAEPLGRRLSRKETRSIRHKIKRGLDRAAG